jgi:putative hydrolase of the HAD superfamily
MIVRAILFDADGVTLKRKGYFSDHLAEELDIPREKIQPFFRGEFRIAQRGQGDIREALPPYLEEWGWKDGLDAFLMHWFMFDAQLDEEVVERVLALRGSGIPCYLVSDQEKYRAQYLETTLALSAIYDHCFFSHTLGLLKNDPAFFREVLRRIDVPAKDTRYYDDDPINIDAAAGIGIDARFYTGPTDIE